MKKTKEKTELGNSPKTVQKYIKIAKEHAYYKKTEGYNENDYSFFDVINLNASLEICDRGPADYYYEKAYEILYKKYGKDHPETRQLEKIILKYHIDNVKRMMLERICLTAIYTLPIIFLLIREIYGPTWSGILAFITCYTILFSYWNLETVFVCYLEKRHYQSTSEPPV